MSTTYEPITIELRPRSPEGVLRARKAVLALLRSLGHEPVPAPEVVTSRNHSEIRELPDPDVRILAGEAEREGAHSR